MLYFLSMYLFLLIWWSLLFKDLAQKKNILNYLNFYKTSGHRDMADLKRKEKEEKNRRDEE